jgi:hypothetical protein
MRGIPKDINFIVEDLQNNEKKEFKTLQEIAKEYKVNYYSVYKLYIMSKKNEEKKKQKKLLELSNKIKILDI